MIYLEIILATSFVLFLLSSLVSGINELWALLLNKRGREMRRALRLAFPELDDELMRSFFNHPLISPLKEQPKWDSIRGLALHIINFFRTNKFKHDFLPSYIDSKLFSRALADILVLGKEFNVSNSKLSDENRQLFATVESLDENNFRLFKDMFLNSSLRIEDAQYVWDILNDTSQGSFNRRKELALSNLREKMSFGMMFDPEFQKNALLDRYLTHSGTEVPSTTDFLIRKSPDLEAWLENTTTWFDNYMNRVSGWYKKRSHTNIFWLSLVLVVIFNINLFDTISELYKNQSLRQIWVESAIQFKDAADAKEQIEESITPLTTLLTPQWPKNVLMNLPGWLATAFAISLGAPFWFDILSKAANLRAAGKKKPEQ